MIAMICHEANRAYCAANGEDTQLAWEASPQWQHDSAIDGVMFHLNNPDAEPSHSHENWLAMKVADGWIYGDFKDADKKIHPCMVNYEELPEMQQLKDRLFISVVDTFRDLNDAMPAKVSAPQRSAKIEGYKTKQERLCGHDGKPCNDERCNNTNCFRHCNTAETYADLFPSENE